MDLHRVCVVVPAHNEASVIFDVLQEVHSVFPNVVCVDDGSTDDTAELATRAGAFVLRHATNRGQGAALQTGLEWALLDPSCEAMVTFDADGQHRPEDAAAMVERLEEAKVDVVLGSRFAGHAQGIPVVKRLMLRAATAHARWTTGIPVSDTHNGLRVFSRRAASIMKFQHRGMAHASEVLHLISAHKLAWAEFPVEVRYTDHSLSKGQSLWNSVNILWDLTWRQS
jgi:glycosyltransferase involved in cell wall biosynthesis